MKCRRIFFLVFIFLAVPFFVLAQDGEQGAPPANPLSGDPSVLIETKARQALQEHTGLNDQNRTLKEKQADLLGQINSLNEELLKDSQAQDPSTDRRPAQQKAQTSKKSAVQLVEENKKRKKTEDSLRAQLESIQKETRVLQEDIDRLQAQKQSLRSFSDSLAQERLKEGAGLTQKAVQELREKAKAVKTQQEECKSKIDRLQKGLDLVFSVDFKNQDESRQRQEELSQALGVDQPAPKGDVKGGDVVFPEAEGQEVLDRKKALFDQAIQKLQDFSSDLPLPDQAALSQKNNELIDEIKGLEEGPADNDWKVLEQRIQALQQLIETSQTKGKELQEAFDKIARPQQKILSEIKGLIADEKNLTPQDLERQKIFLKEQIQIVKEQNERLADALKRPEAEQQEKLLKKEQRLQDQVNALEAKNKLLSSKIADLKDSIKKRQKDKELLESLLKGPKGSNADLKADEDDAPSSPQDPSSKKSAWKVPEILR